MEFLKKKCPYCGKENPVGNMHSPGFCNKYCEGNYNYEKKYGRRIDEEKD